MKTVVKILIGVILVGLTLWLADLSAYNAWAASVVKTRDAASEDIFANRSNVFFVLMSLTFVTFMVFSIWNIVTFIRHRRQQNPH